MKMYDKNGTSERMSLSAPDTQLEMTQLTARPRVKPGILDRLRSSFNQRQNQVVEDNEMDDAASKARRRINLLRIEHCEAVAEAMITIESAERQQELFAEANEKTQQSTHNLRQGYTDRLFLNLRQHELRKHEVAALIENGEMSEECAQLWFKEAEEMMLTQARNDKHTTNALADYQGKLAGLARTDDDGHKGRRR